jgi:hypothetical protein
MSKMEVFDPPMCCTNGVCGPEPGARLTGFAAELVALGAAEEPIGPERLRHLTGAASMVQN